MRSATTTQNNQQWPATQEWTGGAPAWARVGGIATWIQESIWDRDCPCGIGSGRGSGWWWKLWKLFDFVGAHSLHKVYQPMSRRRTLFIESKPRCPGNIFQEGSSFLIRIEIRCLILDSTHTQTFVCLDDWTFEQRRTNNYWLFMSALLSLRLYLQTLYVWFICILVYSFPGFYGSNGSMPKTQPTHNQTILLFWWVKEQCWSTKPTCESTSFQNDHRIFFWGYDDVGGIGQHPDEQCSPSMVDPERDCHDPGVPMHFTWHTWGTMLELCEAPPRCLSW